MNWDEIKIDRVTVNLKTNEISINDGFLVLELAKGGPRVMITAFSVAYASKHKPLGKEITGLTWNWLKISLKRIQELKGLCKGNTARIVWNEGCKRPESWYPRCKEKARDLWLDKGDALLEKLFLSDRIIDKRKMDVHIRGSVRRYHLPDNVTITLIPDGNNLSKLLASFKFQPTKGTDDRPYKSRESLEDRIDVRDCTLRFHKIRGENLLMRMFEGSRDIRIIDTTLGSFLGITKLLCGIVQEHKQAHVKMLMMNPASALSAVRGRMLPYDPLGKIFPSEVRGDAIKILRTVDDALKKNSSARKRFEIRQYDCFPTVAAVITERSLLATWLLYGLRSRQMTHIEALRGQSQLWDNMSNHYNKVWKDARPMHMEKPVLDVKWRTDGEKVPDGNVAIVVDVLRAGTTIVTDFSMGARELFATIDIDEARQMGKRLDAVLVGERDNKIISGFDRGNSPLEAKISCSKDATIVFTSTNFPHALEAARGADAIFIGTLVNVSAVCYKALEHAKQTDTNITIMLAGEPSEKHAKEDEFFAAHAVKILKDACILSNSANRILRKMAGRKARDVISHSVHAKELIRDGFKADVEYAFDIDKFKSVPRAYDSWITIE